MEKHKKSMCESKRETERESYLPSPWIKSASVFEVVMVQMHSPKGCKNLPSFRNCVTWKYEVMFKLIKNFCFDDMLNYQLSLKVRTVK